MVLDIDMDDIELVLYNFLPGASIDKEIKAKLIKS